MALVKQQAVVFLTFLMLSQPVIAMRMQGKQQVQGAGEQREMDAETAKWCWFSRSNELKHYYFEIKFPDKEEHSTMKLIRDPENPKLVISHNRRWIVRSPPANKDDDPQADLAWEPDFERPTEMQWLSRCFGCQEGDDTEIELRNVKSLKRVRVNVTNPQTREVEEEIGIDITNADGTEESFIGGVYLPRRLMFPAMARAMEENAKFNGLAQEARDSSSEADNMADTARDRFGSVFTGSVGGAVGTGAMAGGSIGVGFGAIVLLAGVPGLGGAVIATMLAGAATGLLAGSAAGLVLGATFGVVVGGSAAMWDLHKQKGELKLSGTEKIWSKMECHSWFKRCSPDLIVPYYSECPVA